MHLPDDLKKLLRNNNYSDKIFMSAVFKINSQKLEKSQVSISKKMDKQTVVYSYNEMLFHNKRVL